MNVLVTGGAGFIGRNLIARLLEEGHTVTCLDDLSTGQWANVECFRENERYRFIEECVTRPFRSWWDRTQLFDLIYNLACPASPEHYQADPIKTLRTCFVGTDNLLDLAYTHTRTFHHDVRVIHASTSEVYGDPKEHPQGEGYYGNTNPVGPRSMYDEGKRVAETLCREYFLERGVDVRVVRIFNTYGPYMAPDDGRVVSNFIVAALEQRPLVVYGNGEQTRSFCYIDDMVNALLKLGSIQRSPNLIVMNLGTPDEITIKQLFDELEIVMERRLEVQYWSALEDDPTKRCPDIRRAKFFLEWVPKTTLASGLRKTVDYFKEILVA